MYTITGGGTFSRRNIDQINANFAELAGSATAGTASGLSVWVRPQYGNNNNAGTYDAPFATMSGASRAFEPGLTVYLEGVLQEEFTAPIVNDISIVGAANWPRQATTSGAPNGGGATWLSPSGGTGILCKLQGQAWKLQNIFFNNSAAQPDVQILTVGDPPAQADAAHTLITGCVFEGADAGIQASGGTNFVNIIGNVFRNFTGAGDTAIEQVTGAGVGTLLGWNLCGNVFYNNVNHVVLPLSRGTITGNNFIIVGHGVTSTVALSLTGGASNSVYANNFNRPLATSPNATLYVGGTNDTWGFNYGTDDFFWGVPDNS